MCHPLHSSFIASSSTLLRVRFCRVDLLHCLINRIKVKKYGSVFGLGFESRIGRIINDNLFWSRELADAWQSYGKITCIYIVKYLRAVAMAIRSERAKCWTHQKEWMLPCTFAFRWLFITTFRILHCQFSSSQTQRQRQKTKTNDTSHSNQPCGGKIIRSSKILL